MKKKKYKTIKVPISIFDLMQFEELLQNGESFTWTFDEINIEFVKSKEQEE